MPCACVGNLPVKLRSQEQLAGVLGEVGQVQVQGQAWQLLQPAEGEGVLLQACKCKLDFGRSGHGEARHRAAWINCLQQCRRHARRCHVEYVWRMANWPYPSTGGCMQMTKYENYCIQLVAVVAELQLSMYGKRPIQP